jgi:hypothetical protein
VLAAGKGRGNALGVSRARFAPDLGAGAASVCGLNGTGQRLALHARLRRGRRPAEAKRGGVSSSGGYGWSWGCCSAAEASGNAAWSSGRREREKVT